jgi:hypothetical protein
MLIEFQIKLNVLFRHKRILTILTKIWKWFCFSDWNSWTLLRLVTEQSHPRILQTFINCVQTGSGAHPASYPVGTAALSLRVKRPEREADHSPPSSAEVKECVELYLHSPSMFPWRGAYLSTGATLHLPSYYTKHIVGCILYETLYEAYYTESYYTKHIILYYIMLYYIILYYIILYYIHLFFI